jgi:hypothetical protein
VIPDPASHIGDPDEEWRQQTTQVSRVAVRLPPYWAEQPAVWFAKADAQFTLAGISSEKTKFCHVISQLDHRYATGVEDIFTSPPERNHCSTLRTKLVRRLSHSREHCIRQLLPLEEMRDQKPSQFLRHFRSLAQECQTTSPAESGPVGYPPT